MKWTETQMNSLKKIILIGMNIEKKQKIIL